MNKVDSNHYPLVSFIIPTLNSDRTIKKCIEKILDQSYDNVEIIIVDGYSTDKTLSIVNNFPIKIIFDKGSLGQARQKGFEASKGEILAIFDSDIYLPSKTWLRDAVPEFRDDTLGILWPKNVAPNNASWVSKCYFNFWYARVKDGKSLPGGNVLINRDAFMKSGGYNTNLHWGEDFELSARILNCGYDIKFTELGIIHDSMHSLSQFLRKQIVGASTIVNYREKGTDIDLLYTCMSWKLKDKESRSFFRYVYSAIDDQIMVGLRSMFKGLIEKEPSWVVLPLLIIIRVGVYLPFYIKDIIHTTISSLVRPK